MSLSSRAARAVAVACFAAVSVAAQGIHPQFGLGGGLTAPVGDYHATAGGQGFNTAWHGLALLAFKLPVFPLGFRIDLSYAANSANDRLKDTLSSALGQPTAAHLKPYAIAGVGLYHTTISISTSESTADRAATKLAWNMGGGVALALRGVTLFFETRYVIVAAVSGFPRTTCLPFTTGIRFGGR